ncbi:MAG: hypothetical protein JXA22_08965 [Candidatus Thermoplasmatota archaeon]|nr:hypothetical protein [Candidatus Thermoplasmatota archaeon]
MEPLRLGAPKGILWRMDRKLLFASKKMKTLVIVLTILFILIVRVWFIPGEVIDLGRMNRQENLGGDFFADNYTGKVVLNDPLDMYTKEKVDLNGREASYWEKEECSPYPPLAMFILGGLHFIGDLTGIELIGVVYLLELSFVVMVLIYCLKTRWYLFPLIMLNVFAPHRVYTMNGTTNLLVLMFMMAALLAAKHRRSISHHLVAMATCSKFMTVFYADNVFRMPRKQAMVYVGILVAGLVLPIFIFDNYLYIYSFHATRGYSFVSSLFDHFGISMSDTIAIVLTWTVPSILTIFFTILLFYIENRLGYDWEERVGWSGVPFALFIGLRLLTVRFLFLMLLLPDKRGTRTFLVFLLSIVHMTLFFLDVRRFAVDGIWGLSTISLFTLFIFLLLGKVGWGTLKKDLGSPVFTVKELFLYRPSDT